MSYSSFDALTFWVLADRNAGGLWILAGAFATRTVAPKFVLLAFLLLSYGTVFLCDALLFVTDVSLKALAFRWKTLVDAEDLRETPVLTA